jgi:hypothetical protein
LDEEFGLGVEELDGLVDEVLFVGETELLGVEEAVC